MNLQDISKSTPVEPYINPDGWYAQCYRCWTEITPTDKKCPKCGQKQDWSWLKVVKKE
jgi:rRNA maturation endonuclease Nob1